MRDATRWQKPGPSTPKTLGCYICDPDHGPDSFELPQKRVVAVRDVELRRDRTEVYRLECGHVVL